MLCFLRPCDISCSFPTATAVLSLRAGLSLRYLSEFPGPPQIESFGHPDADPVGGALALPSDHRLLVVHALVINDN